MAQPATQRLVTEAALANYTTGGDLSGQLKTASVNKLKGVAITGTPGAGTVLVATSETSASWQSLWSYPWTDVPLASGFAYRPGGNFNLQVAKDVFGMVHLRGNMSQSGFTGTATSYTFATVPSWAKPIVEVRWLGAQGGGASEPFSGYIATADGSIVLQVDTATGVRIPRPTNHWTIVAQPWQA